MKKLTFLFVMIFGFQAFAQTPEKVVNDFFTALSQKDVVALDNLTLDDMNLHNLTITDSIVLSATSKEKFIAGFKTIPKEIVIEERIFDVESLVSENLAQFQVPYEFYVNGKMSHSGTNILCLLKTKDGWKISYIADTRLR